MVNAFIIINIIIKVKNRIKITFHNIFYLDCSFWLETNRHKYIQRSVENRT